jgi:flagellar biosynthesis activator protein FlaF
MHQAAQAYQQTAKAVESPREREAVLLMRAAAMMQTLRDNWDAGEETIRPTMLFNRKLWSVFLTSATSEESPLPVQARQNIANLGLYVMNQTREMLLQPAPEKLDTLININRQLAGGLRGR